MSLLHTLISEPFLIETRAAQARATTILNLLTGTVPDKSNWHLQRKANFPQITVANAQVVDRYDLMWGDVPENSILVLPVKGEIMRYSQMSGPRGTEALVNDLQIAAENDNIIGAVLDMDTPGGQVDYTDIAANAVKTFGKPIAVHSVGMVASAGYWIASAADKLFSGSPLTTWGSIGTMVMFWDMQDYFKRQGIELKTVYATASTEKNKAFHDLMSGKYEAYRKEQLDPINAYFHGTVTSNRPQLSKDMLDGRTLTGDAAKAAGLFDEYGSLTDAIKWVSSQASKAKQQNTRTQLNNHTPKTRTYYVQQSFDDTRNREYRI